MIDIHCHILPDLDDGAADLEEAVAMARMAWRSGVTDIAATPHFQGVEQELEHLPSIRRRSQLLTQALAREQIPVRLHPGAEVLCLPQTPALAMAHRLPTLGEGSYVLTEFYFDESFAFMDQILSDIAGCGYRIVVAHPERYHAIQRDPGLAARWARQGYALQLNKGSILGAFGPEPEAAAHGLLGRGLVHLIATDAHASTRRTPHVGALLDWARERCDPAFAQILLEENPRRILSGRDLVR